MQQGREAIFKEVQSPQIIEYRAFPSYETVKNKLTPVLHGK